MTWSSEGAGSFKLLPLLQCHLMQQDRAELSLGHWCDIYPQYQMCHHLNKGTRELHMEGVLGREMQAYLRRNSSNSSVALPALGGVLVLSAGAQRFALILCFRPIKAGILDSLLPRDENWAV